MKYYNILSGSHIGLHNLRAKNENRRDSAAFCNYNEEYIIVSGGLQGSKVLDSVVRYDIA